MPNFTEAKNSHARSKFKTVLKLRCFGGIFACKWEQNRPTLILLYLVRNQILLIYSRRPNYVLIGKKIRARIQPIQILSKYQVFAAQKPQKLNDPYEICCRCRVCPSVPNLTMTDNGVRWIPIGDDAECTACCRLCSVSALLTVSSSSVNLSVSLRV